MLRRFTARAVTPVTGARLSAHIPITEPLGKGRVIPLKFETLKPVYNPRTWCDMIMTMNLWLWAGQIPMATIAFTIIWACHGGFTGHLPPDPHELFP